MNSEFQLPLVSIGIPLFNDAAFVKRTVDSALAQSYRNIEIIISDNCSSDETHEVLISSYSGVTNVKLFRQPKNIGPNANFEFLMKQAHGEFFMWLGGHDFIHSDYVALAVEVHQSNHLSSLVYFQHSLMNAMCEELKNNPLKDISSDHPNPNYRALKIFNNLDNCTHIHGLWRTKFRHSIKFSYNLGPDHLVLFILGLKGTVHEINKKYYYRVVNRENESYDEALKRYATYGYKGDVNDVWFTILKVHLNYSLRNFKWSLFMQLARSQRIRFYRYVRGFYFLR
ncbi:MAG: glycosyltransferase family 2 protein [Flavobacteriales bacterium]